MVYYICRDVTNALSNMANKHFSEAERILDEIKMAVSRGHHYIFIEDFLKDRTQKIVKKYFRDWEFSSISKANRPDSINIFSIVKKILVISFNNVDRLKNEPWYHNHVLIKYDPSKHSTLQLDEETHIISEFLSDSKFFIAISKRLIHSKNFHKKIELKSFMRNGGGKTIVDLYEQELNLKEHLCITLADSDKSHPADSYGSTASMLKGKEDKSYELAEVYYMDSVREIENLIPFKFLQKQNKPVANILNGANLSFFDLKLGLTAGILKTQKYYDYWTANNVKLPPYSQVCAESDTKQLIQGFGGSTMSTFMKNRGYESQIIGLKDGELSAEQRVEYGNIGQKILDWCISFPPSRV